MLFLEIVALLLMLACLGQAGRYAWRRERQLVLPILLYLTVAAMLFFAAFGGDSQLVTDTETMVTRAVGLAALGAVVGGYAFLVRKARARAAEREEGS
ncbi:MAG: hypothetical protein AAFT19_02910 [Pseudomonadota bacterium]